MKKISWIEKEEKKLIKQFKKDAEKAHERMKKLPRMIETIIRDEVHVFIKKYHCVDCGTRVSISNDFCGYCGCLTKP